MEVRASTYGLAEGGKIVKKGKKGKKVVSYAEEVPSYAIKMPETVEEVPSYADEEPSYAIEAPAPVEEDYEFN